MVSRQRGNSYNEKQMFLGKKALAIYEGAFAGAAATRFRILSRSTFL
jgi:hypothetical protein